MLFNSTAIANAEIKYALIKIKEIARTQAQHEEFSIEEIENSNEFMTDFDLKLCSNHISQYC
jgi:hypothetical protein